MSGNLQCWMQKNKEEMMCEFIYSKACVTQHVQHHYYNSYYSRAGACGTIWKHLNVQTLKRS